MDLQSRLIEILMESPNIGEILRGGDQIHLPNWYVAAGAIPTTVWNCLTGNPLDRFLNDIDIVYFDDQDVSEDTEKIWSEKIRKLFKTITCPLDVKNQARVHLWYRDKNGQPIKAYKSTEDGIDMWLSVTAVGVRCLSGVFSVYAPYGLDDLFGMRVRPNHRIISRSHYHRKIERWQKQWPTLKPRMYSE